MQLDAIIFDVGNTLAPWGPPEGDAFCRALRPPFEAALGPLADFETRAFGARDRLMRERLDSGFREVTCAEYVEAVCGAPAPPDLAEAVEAHALTVFLDLLRVPPEIPSLLETLGRRYRLGVLSNFFLARPIVAALERAGIADAFTHIEVSAMAGYMKPHPAPFETVREKLGTLMERTLMVGDDFWADIVGGHRAGLLTALTKEHRDGPEGDARAPAIAPDRILRRLHELAD